MIATQSLAGKTPFEQAKQFIPGGVNSPVRAFGSVGGSPVFIDSAQGAYLYDIEGKKYIDYVGSWGSMILGHAHPDVISAVESTIKKGLSFGAPTEIETKLAAKVCEILPSVELVRMVSSGTEATMSAIRLARGFTGRDTIVKFEGCYHGHSDALLVKAGSGALTLGVPSSPGVPAALAHHTVTLRYNDAEYVKSYFDTHGDKVACIIVEPVAGNMNCVPPQPGFLEMLREVCDRSGSILIFDEVMTGFRVALGGAQSHYNVTPDLTTLGKVIGGGMPVGAFGGRKAIMQHIAPLGPVYQAGTLSGNPVAMAAGLTTLNILTNEKFFYERLDKEVVHLTDGLCKAAAQEGLHLTANNVGGMFGLFFNEQTVHTFEGVMQSDSRLFIRFFKAMLKAGVYFAPSAFEAGFISSSHSRANIEQTIDIARQVFREMAKS